MKNCAAVLLLSLLCCAAFCAEDPRPTEKQIKEALARGAAARKQTGVADGVLFATGMVLKIGGVHCGQGSIRLEDAKGANGAVYLLKEDLQAVYVNPDNSRVIGGYNAEIELGADFGLLGAKAAAPLKQEKPDGTSQTFTYTTTLKFKEKVVHWDLQVLNTEGKVMQKTGEKFKLYDTRPVPKTLLSVIAMLHNRANPGDITAPLAVPAFETGILHDSFQVETAWVTLQPAADGALNLRVRGLVSDIQPEGYMTDVPTPEIWDETRDFVLDKNFRWTKVPGLAQPGSTFEIVDAATLEAKPVYDMEKIRLATKAANEAAAKAEEAEPKKK